MTDDSAFLEEGLGDGGVDHPLSGGGSAICEKPISPEISVDDCRDFYRLDRSVKNPTFRHN